MIVVPDAGPLIYLAAAGKLHLLVQLYDRVVVPLVVYDEIVVAGAGLPGSAEVSASPWLEVEDTPPDPVLAATLGRGEAAAIPLAERLGAMLLCDDARGRTEARRRGLPVIGTLGVLVLAKDRRLLDRIGPVIEAMRAVGMYVSDGLVREALTAAGEGDESARRAAIDHDHAPFEQMDTSHLALGLEGQENGTESRCWSPVSNRRSGGVRAADRRHIGGPGQHRYRK